ncbi:S9 family peptidase [Mucilaginibacter agri]|uniref:Prolyl oligopeptidase family serine peptidase n=1 Tax=Mucilaginibacter agri TaxID=2695265 RepID=A0A966DW53_9SPHI|nr:S9 family peptidase [Mucilaginibacter agri]NCD72176.1 prolyl oligopeptidase family serine peptidase [Mucilaginibacter agri]
MKRLLYILMLGMAIENASAQSKQTMTPELLWKLGRLGSSNLTTDGKHLIYTVTHYNMAEAKSEANIYSVPVTGGAPTAITHESAGRQIVKVNPDGSIIYFFDDHLYQMDGTGKQVTKLSDKALADADNVQISPDGKKIMFSREVPVVKILGKDRFADLPKSNAYVFTDLNYRHWDTWEDGKFSHVFVADYDNGKVSNEKDIMVDEPYDTPQKPSGGAEDLIFSPDSKSIIYVCKKKFGKAYAISTNTDLYQYDIATGTTSNLTEGMMGYDTSPAFTKAGNKLAWLSMKEDGYESDKNDIVIKDLKTGNKVNLTEKWDETVSSFQFSDDGNRIFFVAPKNGTEQLFQIDLRLRLAPGSPQAIRQVTNGQWDVNDIIAQTGNTLYVQRADLNHANEIYSVSLTNGSMAQVTSINKAVYDNLPLSRVDERHIKTTDNKDMLAWVIYPPDFDPAKKYPTLLFCQGGPQAPLTQAYSFRWNFQLMAAQGYIIIAPNRRGMPGHGVEWNREISGDWGGQPIKDYLSAIDDIAKEPYVDKSRLGCVGASYGGYSVYMLAGVHEGRFKTFIAHDGLFDLKSWYGTTEELWFANKDMGGNYWDKDNKVAQKSYDKFNPSNLVSQWNTPIMVIQGGKDYRVPIEQGLGAYQAAQLKGIKSKLLYLPDENHWVLKPQNALVWQREFFGWLKETL